MAKTPRGDGDGIAARADLPQQWRTRSNTSTTALNATLLPAGTTAIGADFGLQTGNTATSFQLKLTLSNSDILFITLAASNSNPILSFFGFTSDVPITSIAMSVNSVNSGNGSLVVDNFTFGQSAVPEPATMSILIMTGGIFAGVLVYRRA